MNVLSIIALVMIVQVSYASGITLASRNHQDPVTLVDLGIVILLWVCAFWTRSGFGQWGAIAVWFAVALILGYLKTVLLYFDTVEEKLPDSELPAHVVDTQAEMEDDRPTNFFARLWRRWTLFAEEMGHVQGRLLMGFFYFIVVTPFALPYRFMSDPLKLKIRDDERVWQEKDPIDLTINAAREQG